MLYTWIQVDFSSTPEFWRPLYLPVKEKLGELLVSLTYVPARNTLTLGVLQVGIIQHIAQHIFALLFNILFPGQELEGNGYQWEIRYIAQWF